MLFITFIFNIDILGLEITYVGPKIVDVMVNKNIDFNHYFMFRVNGKKLPFNQIKGEFNQKVAGDYSVKIGYCVDKECLFENVVIRVRDVIEYKSKRFLKNIPFETNIIDDDKLRSGQEEIRRAGANGMNVLESRDYYVNGIKVGSDPFVEKKILLPQNRIIARGVYLHKQTKKEVKRELIPYRTIYQEDNSLKFGQQKEIQSGQVGYIEIIDNVVYVDNEEVERKEESRKQVKEPVDRIILRNLKYQADNGDSKGVVYHIEIVPFDSVTINDNSLPVGYREIRQMGTEGLALIGEKKNTAGKMVEVERSFSVEPVNELIVIGTKKNVEQINYQYHNDVVPFYQYFVSDSNLSSENYVVLYKGEAGFRERKYKINMINDKESSRGLIEENEKLAYDQLIKYGEIAADNKITLTDSIFGVSVVLDKNWLNNDDVNLLVSLASDSVNGVFGNSFSLNFIKDISKIEFDYPIEIRIPMFNDKVGQDNLLLYVDDPLFGISVLDYKIEDNTLVTRAINPHKITLVRSATDKKMIPNYKQRVIDNSLYEILALVGLVGLSVYLVVKFLFLN